MGAQAGAHRNLPGTGISGTRQDRRARPSNSEDSQRRLPWGDGVVEVLKVSSRSNPNSVAGALAGVLRQSGAVEVQVVGAGALNQAVKAIAIARGFVAPSNIDLVCIPTFADIEIDGEGRTAIRLAVEDRTRRKPSANGVVPPAVSAPFQPAPPTAHHAFS